MVGLLPMSNQNFSGDPEEPNEVLGANEETKSHLLWQFLGLGKSCEELFLNHCTSTPHRSETIEIAESSAQSERRDICGVVAVGSVWKLLGGFHRVLLLSEKHSRSLVWWEDTMWMAVRNTIERTSIAVWSNGRISPYICERHIEIWSKSLTRHIPRLCIVCGANLERRHHGRRHRRMWRRWTHQNSTQEGSKQRKCYNADERW